jgi:nicotinate-nucleotide adenylyltransferase
MHRSAPIRFGRIKAMTPLAGEGQRIGLLGGSFNPPHAAHVLISDIAKRRLGLDAVWWLVTPGNPLKSKSELAPLAQRIAACKAMTGRRRIKITGLEAHLSSSLTAATLAYLRLRHPDKHFVWLMGADNLAQFHRWQHWRSILACMPVAVIDRPGWHMKALSSRPAHAFNQARIPENRANQLANLAPPAWTFLTGPLLPHSSSRLRVAQKPPKSAP